jgi:hypothetical protein
MREACSLIWSALVLLFRSRASLAAEILVLRHQINILRRHSPKRQTFSAMDRLIFAGLYRLAPTVLNALAVLKPDTVIKWHRAGFRSSWRWRSRRRGGRPTLRLSFRRGDHEDRDRGRDQRGHLPVAPPWLRYPCPEGHVFHEGRGPDLRRRLLQVNCGQGEAVTTRTVQSNTKEKS